ncbi:MAG: Mu transposase C-terminal domain-containing protein [Holophagales bacterium]|nr:Mu transposase C-terminal domain-containing protein [Holophagales bacterium]
MRSAFLPLLQAEHLQDLAALNRVFWAWLEGEYHVSPHGGLDGEQTPLDRFLADSALIRPAPEDLDRLLRMSVSRRVAKDRTVRLDGCRYEAPDGYAGETVDILYDPYSSTAPVHLRRRGEREEARLRLLDPITNARLRPSRSPRTEPATDDEPPAPTGIRYLDLLAERHFGDTEEEK